MPKTKIEDTLKRVLEEKKAAIVSRVHQVQENLMTQLEEIKDLDEFTSFDLPDDIVPHSEDAGKTIDFIHKSTLEISSSVNQLKLITNLLNGINNFSSRSALFLLRDDKLVGWRGKGFSNHRDGITDQEVKKVFFSLSANTIFKHALEHKKPYSGPPVSQPDDHLIFSRFGGQIPDEIYILPFFVKGKPQAVIYADSIGGQVIGRKEIEVFAKIGEMSLDLLPLRQKILARVKTQEFIGEPEPDTEAEFSMQQAEEKPAAPSLRMNDPERKARVILNDIILYNQRVVDEGIQNGNLYAVLKDTIAQAKDEYLRKHQDLSIFETQMVKILGRGNKNALQGYPFETI